jgi:hypothetical protein
MYRITKMLLKSQWGNGTSDKRMSISNLKLSQNDLTLLVLVIEGYLKSLDLPTLYPEHLCEYRPVLEKLKATFQRIVVAHGAVQLSLSMLDVIALGEAVEGFIRLFERSEPPPQGTPFALVKLNQFRRELAMIKVPSVH